MMGNPWSYRGHTLEWSRIRLLTKWDDIEMEYNASGMRTRKGDTYYELDGNNIISETTNGNTIRYYYGNGGIVGFRYNGNRYYYEKNLQGDIIGIYDEDANKLCEYVYDAWGNCSIENDISGVRIGEINSFRYRGYYYDSDIGLYYLKSRYYDPQVARFINADGLNYLGANGDLGAYNLFAYCSCNPVGYIDNVGHSTVVIALSGAAFGLWLLSIYSIEALKQMDDNALGELYNEFYRQRNKRSSITSGKVGTNTPVAPSIPAVPSDTIASIEYPFEDEKSKKREEYNIFYGIDLRGGTWKVVTGAMNYETALSWVLTQNELSVYGKGAKWGLYTQHSVDALAMATILGFGLPPEHDDATVGTYAHYHPYGRVLLGKYAHFHIWYGLEW